MVQGQANTTGNKILGRIIALLSKLGPFIRWVSIVGMVIFMAMVCLTFANVILRYIFNSPLIGSMEILEIMMAVVVFTGIAWVQLSKSHVTMDLVTGKLKPKPKLVLEGFSNSLVIVLLIILIWRSGLIAINETKETGILEVPLRYPAMLVPFGCILLVLVFIRDFLQNIQDSLKYGKNLWLQLVGIPVVVIAFAGLMVAFQPVSIPLPILGIIGLIVMFILFFTGMPIGFALMGIGFIFLGYIRGGSAGFEVLGKTWYDTVASFPWSPIMFFILMGYLCFYSNLGRDLFDTAARFIGHLRGGLAMGVVAACTAFGAVVGDNLSGTITMNAISLPEMRKHGYDDSLAIGTLCTSGTIGTLIPPSISFILYALLTDQSIGDLFMAGIIPGIVCCLVFMGLIYLRCRINPRLGPPGERYNWHERMASLKSAGPIGLLFILVIGGLYAGIFTATEGGAIGAFGAFVIALAMRRLDWKKFTSALVDANKGIAITFTILGGAVLLGYFIVQTKIPFILAQWVVALIVPSIIIILAIVVIYFILGCFLPVLPMLLITIPIFLPILQGQGGDLIWFGVIVALMANMAAITPPFGINLFVMPAIAGVSIGFTYRSAMPFVVALFVVVALVIAFPALSTWLPYLLR
jgi:tripartite ATP-independent transporter DctM subunit